MPFEQKITLPGSAIRPLPNSQAAGAVPADEMVTVTVVVRRRQGLPPHGSGVEPRRYSYQQFAQNYGADESDLTAVETYAHQAGLTVMDRNAAKRRVSLRGPSYVIARAFGATLSNCRLTETDRTYRCREGSLTIPKDLEGIVVAVLGLDNRPIAKPHFRIMEPRATPAGTFTPPQVAALYEYPKNATGSGQTVGIIELGGGYTTSDLKTYFQELGVKEPKVTAVSVDGGSNSPGTDADGEVMLDIEVVGAIAPGANIAVYFAPNTDQGFIDAVTDAVHDTTNKPSVISISWGGPEDSWTAQSQTAMNAALQDAASLGVTVTVACGDNGSSDGVSDGKLHVDFPAASSYALACGGTKLTASGTRISSEVVWNGISNQEGATGGGVSTVFAVPAYQTSAGVPPQAQTKYVGRGVPDVAGNADPSTGYQIRVGGQNQVVGGTSAVAPLWAALVALLNQQLGTPVGFLNPKLYPLGESAFHDITSGNNDDSGLGGYDAKSGWDPCTGLGSPNGTALLSVLTTSSSSAAGSVG